MGVNGGSSAGALVAGLLIGRLPLGVCFLVTGATALASAALAAGGRTTGAARAPRHLAGAGERPPR